MVFFSLYCVDHLLCSVEQKGMAAYLKRKLSLRFGFVWKRCCGGSQICCLHSPILLSGYRISDCLAIFLRCVIGSAALFFVVFAIKRLCFWSCLFVCLSVCQTYRGVSRTKKQFNNPDYDLDPECV